MSKDKIAEIRELIESRRQGNCMDVPMREACAKLCDVLEVAIKALNDIQNECFGKPALAKIDQIFEGK